MASTVIKYVGRTTNFQGKTLWEIVGSLKSLGVGRYIVRSVFERYPEPSFMKIVKVETCPDEVASPSPKSTRSLHYTHSRLIRHPREDMEWHYSNPTPHRERRRVRVWVEKTFRGKKHEHLTEIYRTSYKPDYKLIPKNEEAKLLTAVKERKSLPEVILPNSIDMPPLMRIFLVKEHEKKGQEVLKEFTMPLSYNASPNRVARIAKPGEKPTIQFTMGLGKPASPSLYKGVPLNS